MYKCFFRSRWPLIVCVFLSNLPAIAAAAPIPAGPDAFTYRDYQAEHLKYRLLMVEDYQRCTRDKGEARQLAVDFLHEYARAWAGMDDQLDAAELFEMCRAARKAGSEDPLIF